MKALNLYVKHLLLTFIAFILTACSQGKCLTDGNSKVQELSLEMSAPSQYPARMALDMPVLVTNTGNTVLNNMAYTIPTSSNTTGVNLTITAASQSDCATLAIGQTCQLTVQISNNSKPGAFKVLAHNNQLNAEQAVFIGLIDIPPSSGVGADGIALLYNPTLIRDSSTEGKLYNDVLVTMVVTSENVGQFNTLQIIDSNGNILRYEVLTGNSGEGMTNLSVGSVVTLSVKVPSGSTQLVFKPLLKSDKNGIPNGEGQNQVIDIVPPTVKKASLDILTPIVNLNESSPNQTITIVNNGNAPASSFNINIGDHIKITNSTCGSSLAAGASCTYTIAFDDNQPIVGTTFSEISYFDGTNTVKRSSTINYRGKRPFVGLTLSSNNFAYTFNATTESPIYASVVTITNAGEVLPLTLANLPTLQYFDVSTTAGTANDCTTNQVLEPGSSCNILVTYNNATALSGTADMDIGYSYTDIDRTQQTGKTSVSISYNTLQSVAVLSYGIFEKSVVQNNNTPKLSHETPNSVYNFEGIVNNGVETTQQIITITNIGQAIATAVTVISPAQPFHILSNGCGDTIAQGASCQLIVEFGPVSASNTTGTIIANLLTNYLPYPSATVNASISAELIGYVYFANTAILNTGITSSTGFVAGSGNFAQPYQIQNNANNGTVTYTLTNSGEAPANEFYVSYNPNVLLPWSITNNTCGTQQSRITLEGNGGSCTIEFKLDTSNIGSSNLNLSNLQMNWVDQDSPNGETQVGTGIVYTNVFASPIISVSISPTSIAYYGANAIVTFTLSGGYNVESQLVSITGSTPNDGNLGYPNGSSCKVSHNSTSCSIAVSQTKTGIKQNYTLSLNNAGNVPLNNYSVDLDVVSSFYSFNSPRQIAFNLDQSGVFITNPASNVVSYCDVVDNNLIDCVNSGTGLSYPFGIGIDKSGTYAFISNFSNSTITRCNVSGRLLTNCTDTGATSIKGPYWLNFNNTGDYIFFGNSSYPAPSVTACWFNGGNLNSCADSGSGLEMGMNQVTVKSAGDYSFVTNYTRGTISTCTTDGPNLSDCVDSGATALNAPVYLVLNKTETYAFISNYNGNNITQCSVSGGTLSNCSDSGATNLSGPEGIYLNPAGTYLYITNVNNNTIIRCSVNGNRLSNCKLTGFN